MEFDDIITNIEKISEFMEKLNKTLLIGWQKTEMPTKREAEQIVEIYHVLGVHLPHLIATQRWIIAGNCVSRFPRS